MVTPLLSPCTIPQCLIVLIVFRRLHSSSATMQVFVPHRGADAIKPIENNEKKEKKKSDTEGQMTPSLRPRTQGKSKLPVALFVGTNLVQAR